MSPNDTDAVSSGATGHVAAGPEVEAVEWIFSRVAEGRPLPAAEAGTVLNTLFAEQCWGGRAAFPLRPVAEPVSFLSVHSVNVANVAMALGSTQQFDSAAVRAIGLAALLHDIGMARIPGEIWRKEGQLTAEERDGVKRHTIEGARLLLGAHTTFDLAATVAYEHHLRMDGSGYPVLTFPRPAHFVSRLVQVCDVFCALSTDRPYRKAWPLDVILSFLEERSGFEFHPTLAAALKALTQNDVATAAL